MKKSVGSDYVLTFGKYSGMSIDEISEIDLSYVIWLNEQKILKIEREFMEACLLDEYECDVDYYDIF